MSFKLYASAGVSAMILGSTPALAQDGGPIVVGEREQLESFRFYNVRAGVDFFAAWRRQEVQPAVGSTRTTEELDFRESVDVAGDAFVLHPNFLDIDMFFRFGARQMETTRSGFGALESEPGTLEGRNWTYDYLLEHDVTATFLQRTRAPLALYTRRNQTILSRPFGESFDSVTTEHGARLTFRDVEIPTEFAFFRREQDTSGRRGATDFNIVQDTFSWQSYYAPDSRQFFTWNYDFDDVRQTGALRRTQSFRRHNAVLTHSVDFGEDEQHNLRSSAALFEEDGTFELTRVRWTEALRLRHTPRFETRYNYALDYTTRPGTDQILHSGSAGFRHRLFESLTSVGTVGASRLSISDGHDFTSDTLFADLELQYTKRIPYGRLAASAGVSYSRQDDSDRNGAIQVIQEPHVFSSTGLVLLQRRNIIVDSIVIMDASGIFTFTRGLDYAVQVFGDRVEIRRIIGGDIQDGQAVLIDYQMQTEPANVTTTFGWRFGARYDVEEGPLRGLGVYGRYLQQDQERTSDFELLFPPADIRDLTLGVDYRVGHLTLLAEHQWHDSTISPYRALRLEGTYARPFGRRSNFQLTANYLDLDRYEDDVRTQITTLTGRLSHQITEDLRVGGHLLWRDERNGFGHVQGFEQQVDFSWRYRQTIFYGAARNATLDSAQSDSSFQNVEFGIRREF